MSHLGKSLLTHLYAVVLLIQFLLNLHNIQIGFTGDCHIGPSLRGHGKAQGSGFRGPEASDLLKRRHFRKRKVKFTRPQSKATCHYTVRFLIPGMPKRVYHVQLRFDAREHTLIDVFKKAYPEGDPDIDWTKNLVLGDVQILVDGVLAFVLERKRNDDFRSAVVGKEQRFRKQRTAMILARKAQPSLLLMFAFEGSVFDLNYKEGTKITPQFLWQLQKELSSKYVIMTGFYENHTDTVRLIYETVECYKEHGSPAAVIDRVKELDLDAFGRKKLSAKPEEAGVEDVEGAANPRYSPQAFFRISLENIYGMTPVKAQLVMELYHNFPNMINTYMRIPQESRRYKLLAKLKAPGDTRFFGPQLSKRIYACVVGDTEILFKKTVVDLDPDAEKEDELN